MSLSQIPQEQITNNQHIKKFKDLILGINSKDKSRLLAEKFSSELATIPELINFIDNDIPLEKNIILSEMGAYMELREYNRGSFLRKIFEINNDFMMILRGKIMEFDIKYIKTSMSFKEYILFLTKIYLLNETQIYYDCIEKNKEAFPLHIFKYYINNKINNKFEEKKISMKDINIIDIGKEINMRDFNFGEELDKLKKKIENSEWKKYDKNKNLILNENDYEIMINSFFELYNLNINYKNINTSNTQKKEKNLILKEIKYKVYIPIFYKKKIITPITFIGDLNRSTQSKNYSSYICLNSCFIIYIDKSKLHPGKLLFKYSHKNKKDYIAEKLFKKHYIFKNVSVEYLSPFGKYMQIMNLTKNEILFRQGEPHRGIYIILKGSLQLDTKQSYQDLIYINFLLMHSLEFCPQWSNINKKTDLDLNLSIKIKNRNILSGYNDYNSDLNILMKNPLFVEKSRIKENIIFCIYKVNDILGLGEVFDYKNKINIFTAKSLSNNTEIIFIPKEIFYALISNEIICNKCISLTEEKTFILNRCINKYRNIFEKKIEFMINNRKNYKKFNKIFLSNDTENIKSLGQFYPKVKKFRNNFSFNSNDFNSNNYIIKSENAILNNNNINNNINNKDEIDKNNISLYSSYNQININNFNKINNNNNDMNQPNQNISLDKNNNNFNEKMLIASTNFDNNNSFNKIKLNYFQTKNSLKPKFPILIQNQNHKRNNVLKSAFSSLYSYKNSKRFTDSVYYLKNTKNNSIGKNKILNNRKMNSRSLSAQRYDTQFINKFFSDNKSNYNNFYNNFLENSKNSQISIKNNMKNINKTCDTKNKKITINKFSSNALFRKSYIKNDLSESKGNFCK